MTFDQAAWAILARALRAERVHVGKAYAKAARKGGAARTSIEVEVAAIDAMLQVAEEIESGERKRKDKS